MSHPKQQHPVEICPIQNKTIFHKIVAKFLRQETSACARKEAHHLFRLKEAHRLCFPHQDKSSLRLMSRPAALSRLKLAMLWQQQPPSSEGQPGSQTGYKNQLQV